MRAVGKFFRSSSVLVVILFVTWLLPSVALGQEQEEQQSPYTEEEYAAYQQAVEKGAPAILDFLKKNPKSALAEYGYGAYLKTMQDDLSNGNHQGVITKGEQFVEAMGADNIDVLYLVTWSSFYSQQFDKAAKWGALVYSKKPDAPQLVPILARSYQKLADQPKFVEFAEKAIVGIEPKDSYDLLSGLLRVYAEQKDWGKAQEYANKVLTAYESVPKPDQVDQGEWDNFVNEERAVGYAVIGRDAAEGKKWAAAEKNFQNSIKASSTNVPRVAESLYYIGMARWSTERIDPAMESFARCSVLKGTPHADPCRKQLESLYKATHNGSLAGLDEFIDRANRRR